MLKCPVCNEILTNNEKQYLCINNHSFDKNKKGYTNLLLSNQLHSIDPGDNKEMINARVNFLKTDKYHSLRTTLYQIINQYINNKEFCQYVFNIFLKRF